MINIRKIGIFFFMLGLEPRRFVFSFINLSNFFFDIIFLIRNYNSIKKNGFLISILPILSDKAMSSGVAKGHYFHQDLWAARRIKEYKPIKHIDIGSRIDGFIAHLLTFMNVTVIDVRSLDSKVNGLSFIQRDIMKPSSTQDLEADSVSCLHALEHFGLGRYGDPIDFEGWKKGIANITSIVCEKGRLYLSVPIGEQRIEFNAHRVFAPSTIINEVEQYGFSLYDFCFVDDNGDFFKSVNIEQAKHCDYGCGCFEFIKNS